jgi:hypothetical protein
MRNILLSSMAYLVLLYFSTLSHKRHDIFKKVIEYKICGLILSENFSETYLTPRRNLQDIILNVQSSSRKVLLLLFVGQAYRTSAFEVVCTLNPVLVPLFISRGAPRQTA